jgi:hypothetical protein
MVMLVPGAVSKLTLSNEDRACAVKFAQDNPEWEERRQRTRFAPNTSFGQMGGC